MLAQGDDLDAHGDGRRGARSAAGREHEWAADAGPARGARRAARRGRRWTASRTGSETLIGAAVRRRAAADRAGPAAARRARSCCCSTSRPTTSTSRRSPGWPGTWRPARGALLVVTHDRWFLDAVCTAHLGGRRRRVHRYDGGYAAYVLARAERDRQAAARERPAPPAAAQGAGLAAARPAGPYGEAEVPHRRRQRADRRRAGAPRPDRAAALRHAPARQQGHRGRGRVAGLRRRDAAATT